MAKIKNEIKRKLKNIASELPFTVRTANDYFFEVSTVQSQVNHNEVINNFDVVNQKNEIQILSDKPDIVRDCIEAHFPVNHFKRLKKAFTNGGWDAVEEYKQWVYKNNQMLNKTIPIKTALHAAKEIEKNIQTIFNT